MLTNHELMKLAVEQMLKCSKHPKVGAVVSKDGSVLSTGFRGEVGAKHAERVAIEKLGPDQLDGSMLYTTLEPCAEIYSDQKTEPCCELIAKSGITTVSIGALDPNGRIYSKGMNSLKASGLSIEVFAPAIREDIEKNTFKYDDFYTAIGSGRRRIRSVRNGKQFTVRFSADDGRTVKFRLHPLSMPLDHIDIVAANDSVRLAPGIHEFHDILDPLLYHDPSHFARLSAGQIAIVAEPVSTMVLLVKVQEITPTDITIQWQVRNKVSG